MELKDTLNLPKTSFPMRGNLAKREPELLERWKQEAVYDKVLAARQGAPKYVLHDGPPYANGHIHYGHILNKVLKDIVVKFKTMQGYKVLFQPGWDCHGLPIEIHVDRQLGDKKAEMSAVEVRRQCRDYAMEYVDIQRAEFERLGCFGTWDDPYLTLKPSYEAAIVRQIGQFIGDGYLYRGRKPVYWCASCETALAEAEVEYKDHSSPSIYVKFPLEDDPGFLADELAGAKVSLVIWTTTPWTLPANLAVVVWPDYEYQALQVGDEYYIVAKDLADSFLDACGLKADRRLAVDAGKLEGRRYRHPFVEPKTDKDFRVWFAQHVTLEQGTGLVHTAPGHGAEDYQVGMEQGLAVYAPVDDKGRFTEDVEAYAGMHVFEANPKVVEDLHRLGVLLNKPGDEVAHSYPHCWRCKQPIVFRATAQWFVNLEHEGLRAKALEEIDRTTWIPAWGRDRIYGMVQMRPDWCLSRQRIWGVPLPILYCESCSQPLLSRDVAEQVARIFEESGSDAWFERPAERLVPEGTVCPHCGGKTFRKETDIVDVWFESGVSWAAVCENNEDLGTPVDLYLEGSDQHRGWFHSALLTGVATRSKAPYKAVLTHGFVVDENGQPYSKSLKNYEPPDKILNKLGAEIFRLWVASEDYRNDIRISDEILKRLSDGYRRIRNTCRFMLGNLADFDPDKDAVAVPGDLQEMDRWVLSRLQDVVERVIKAYDRFEFHKVYRILLDFAATDLSSFYLDVAKDRLYCDATTGASRRAAQTTIYEIVRAVTLLAAPVFSFTAEDLWSHLPHRADDPESVHMAVLPQVRAELRDRKLEEVWAELKAVRQEVTKALEEFRAAKHHPLDAAVVLKPVAGFQRDVLAERQAELADLFIVSSVSLHDEDASGELCEVSVSEAAGIKCPRCWKKTEHPRTVDPWGEVCERCASVLEQGA